MTTREYFLKKKADYSRLYRMKRKNEIGEDAYKKINAERMRQYWANNPDKKRKANAEWNKKNRKEYTRNYCLLKRINHPTIF